MVVLRGGIYSDERKHELVGDVLNCIDDDTTWVNQFINDLRAHAKKFALPLTITCPTRCLEQGCVLVDKVTGKITIPVPANDFEPYRYLHVGLPESVSQAQLSQLRTRDMFYRIISTAHAIAMQQFGLRFTYPCFPQYDGTSPMPLPRIPDFARTILQQYVLYGPIQPDTAIPVTDKMSVKISEELRNYINGYPLREQGMFCEICRKQTKSTCNNCRTAWYCCREHQTSDWKDHRIWCKMHRVPGSVSTPSRRSSGESQSTRFSEKNVPQHEVGDTGKRENTGENLARLLNGEAALSHVTTQEIQAGMIEEITAKPEGEIQLAGDIAPAEESIVNVTTAESNNSLRPQKALTPRDPRLFLCQIRAKLRLVQASDTSAVFHRNLKLLVRILYSWKFYFCIGTCEANLPAN